MLSNDVTLLIEHLGKKLGSRGLSVVTVESCTGGKLASAIVSNPQASSALERGFVVYSVDAKCELLGLDRKSVEQCAGVSRDVAHAMAKSALKKSHADVSVAITGFAGPRENDEEVGLVHIAASNQDVLLHRELHVGDIGREAVCVRAVVAALELLIKIAA